MKRQEKLISKSGLLVLKQTAEMAGISILVKKRRFLFIYSFLPNTLRNDLQDCKKEWKWPDSLPSFASAMIIPCLSILSLMTLENTVCWTGIFFFAQSGFFLMLNRFIKCKILENLWKNKCTVALTKTVAKVLDKQSKNKSLGHSRLLITGGLGSSSATPRVGKAKSFVLVWFSKKFWDGFEISSWNKGIKPGSK